MLKKIFIVALFFLLSFPVLLQLSSAKALALPITSPVTTPVSFFNLTGHVIYHQLGILMNSAQRRFPAANVMITVSNFFGGSQVAATTTDSNGDYHVNLPAGWYRVSASDGTSAHFVPPFRIVNVKTNSQKHADFQGLLFPSF